jgi:probable F420-dependent oxidoreductase
MSGIGGIGGRRLAERMGRVGVWSTALGRLGAGEAGAAALEFETLGFPSLWYPESLGSKDAFSHAALLLASTAGITVASGIANIYARDPMAMANGAKALAEAYGRFVLGIGVSHAPSVANRGGSYGKPIEAMRAYLDAMDAATYIAPEPDPPVALVLAALGPRMLELASERADGAHSYFVPVDHTAIARRHLGVDPFLAVEQTAVLTTDRAAGLRIARGFAAYYLGLRNYANNLRRLGWTDDDLAGEGSERLVDAVVAIGDVDAIVRRIRDQLDAGADHVCVQVRAEKPGDPDLPAYRELAAALGEVG